MYNVYIQTSNENFLVDSFTNKKDAIAAANNPGPAYRETYQGKDAIVSVRDKKDLIYQTTL